MAFSVMNAWHDFVLIAQFLHQFLAGIIPSFLLLLLTTSILEQDFRTFTSL